MTQKYGAMWRCCATKSWEKQRLNHDASSVLSALMHCIEELRQLSNRALQISPGTTAREADSILRECRWGSYCRCVKTLVQTSYRSIIHRSWRVCTHDEVKRILLTILLPKTHEYQDNHYAITIGHILQDGTTKAVLESIPYRAANGGPLVTYGTICAFLAVDNFPEAVFNQRDINKV